MIEYKVNCEKGGMFHGYTSQTKKAKRQSGT